jgi:hypothetical protein
VALPETDGRFLVADGDVLETKAGLASGLSFVLLMLSWLPPLVFEGAFGPSGFGVVTFCFRLRFFLEDFGDDDKDESVRFFFRLLFRLDRFGRSSSSPRSRACRMRSVSSVALLFRFFFALFRFTSSKS